MTGWQETNLGQYVDFRNGKTSPDRDDAMPFPVYGSNGVIGRANISNANENSIVIGRVGSYCGSLYFSKSKAWVTDNAIIAEAKKGNNPLYFFYLMSGLDLNHLQAGSGQPLINQSILSSIKTAVAPQPEQRAIAAVLGTLDDKIELNSRMNATLEAAARALFKSWFVDFDPVKAKMAGKQPFGMDASTAALFPARLTESDLGDIPEGWEVKPLDEIANFLNGLALQKYPQTDDDCLPVIKIAELRQGITNNSNRASLDLPKEYIVEDGDVLFSWSGSLMQVLWTGGKGALNQHLFKVTSNYPKWFHYYWVEQHMPWFRQVAASKATTMGHIQRMHLTQAKVLLPNAPVMQAADKMIAPLFQKKLEIGMENKGLERTRDYLLPKLISGEIRIPDAEQFVEGL